MVFGFSRIPAALACDAGAYGRVATTSAWSSASSLVQTKTPDYVRGRVNAINSIFISCSNQLGAVESGWTAALVRPGSERGRGRAGYHFDCRGLCVRFFVTSRMAGVICLR